MTVLSYYPNFGANIFFAVAFGLIVLVSATIGTWKRTWTFMALVTGGCVLETVGTDFPALRFLIREPIIPTYNWMNHASVPSNPMPTS